LISSRQPVLRLDQVHDQALERRRVQALGYEARLRAGQLRLLIGHLEEQQERDLLRVPHVRQAVVAQHVRETPRAVDDLLRCVVRHGQAAASG
jgi:hypothetical protein